MAKKKRGPGRPKLAKGEARGSVITIRLQKNERKAVGDEAKRKGMKLSAWVRDVLLSASGADSIPSSRPEGAGIEPHGADDTGP